jgi:thioredoxin reductase (NADPH)
MTTTPETVVILGSGPAGLTAGIYAARANLRPLIIDGATPGGQLMSTSWVENWPGHQRILGPELMMTMRKQTEALGARFLQETAALIDVQKKPFSITTDRGTTIQTQTIIIATGAIHKRLGCPGEDTYWGKGVTVCAVCDGAFYPQKRVMVVGGGDSAMEDASFLKKFTEHITVVHILDKLTASHAMQQRIINDPAIKIIYNSTVTAIEGNGQHVTSVAITDQKTHKIQKIDIDGIFVAIGLKPNTAFLQNQIEIDQNGYILVHDDVKTSVDGIFAAGDVHDYKYRQAIASAGNGCIAAFAVQEYLQHMKK